VMAKTRAARLNVSWRVIGKAVVTGAQLSPEIADVLEPPLSEPDDLAAAYAWADVVVLLSRYEGLPLTILEAQRAGAWVIATDVGAVSEAIRPGENGTLIGDATAVEDCVRALEEIMRQPDRFRKAPLARGRHNVTSDWTDQVGRLAEAIDRLSQPEPPVVPTRDGALPDGPARAMAKPEHRIMKTEQARSAAQNAL
jgi:glycosyltransferase involved in cell wall biosynthesis